jgi:hypothetical protein
MRRLLNYRGSGIVRSQVLSTKSAFRRGIALERSCAVHGASDVRLGGNRVFACVAVMSVAAILSVPSKCEAQNDQPAFHSITLHAGGGVAFLSGTDAHNFDMPRGFQFGGGKALLGQPKQEYDQQSNPLPLRRWNIFLTGNFIYQQSAINLNAVREAIALNPQNTALLSATSGTAKFYSTTLDFVPRFEASRRVSVYALGGFGWLRRTLVFEGVSSQGSLLQPSGPTVFAPHRNSGVVDGGAGIDFGVFGRGSIKLFGEVRVLHGLATNSGTTLVPLSAGVRW